MFLPGLTYRTWLLRFHYVLTFWLSDTLGEYVACRIAQVPLGPTHMICGSAVVRCLGSTALPLIRGATNARFALRKTVYPLSAPGPMA